MFFVVFAVFAAAAEILSKDEKKISPDWGNCLSLGEWVAAVKSIVDGEENNKREKEWCFVPAYLLVYPIWKRTVAHVAFARVAGYWWYIVLHHYSKAEKMTGLSLILSHSCCSRQTKECTAIIIVDRDAAMVLTVVPGVLYARKAALEERRRRSSSSGIMSREGLMSLQRSRTGVWPSRSSVWLFWVVS